MKQKNLFKGIVFLYLLISMGVGIALLVRIFSVEVKDDEVALVIRDEKPTRILMSGGRFVIPPIEKTIFLPREQLYIGGSWQITEGAPIELVNWEGKGVKISFLVKFHVDEANFKQKVQDFISYDVDCDGENQSRYCYEPECFFEDYINELLITPVRERLEQMGTNSSLDELEDYKDDPNLLETELHNELGEVFQQSGFFLDHIYILQVDERAEWYGDSIVVREDVKISL